MIVYKNGDTLTSTADVICHQVNCKGVMGAGLAKQIRDKYPNVYDHYKWHCKTFGQNLGVKSSLLGNIILDFGKDIDNGKQIIASLFAQDGYGRDKRYTDYEALRKSLKCLSLFLGGHENTIAIPYQMGCGLGGGDWNIVLSIIEEELASYTVEIWKYTK
ncbi:MAG: macro domain-containing protein [Acutalibacteraceae bacterium]|nr:macro domain-containing protein [Acutalibacteraceae bacterium]